MYYKNFIFTTTLLLSFPMLTLTLSCTYCAKDACTTPQNCAAGLTLDPCNCCLECAKNINETCGGNLDLEGICGIGLYCQPNKKYVAGDSIQPASSPPGVCKECKSVVYSGCNLVEETCQCGESCTTDFEYSSLGRCQVARNGDNLKCRGVICAEDERPEDCPIDSIRPSAILSTDGCCLNASSCTCNYQSCPAAPLCGANEKSVVTTVGSGTPGRCCPQYTCQSVKGTPCVVSNASYPHGESWEHTHCMRCTCNNGMAICDKRECEPLSCGWQTPGECCPRCKGCVSSETGQHYVNSATWTEHNSCTHCQCVDGQSFCNAAVCAKSCTNPIRDPGQCCPVCATDEVIYGESEFTTELTVLPCSATTLCPAQCFYKESVVNSAQGCSICLCLDEDNMCNKRTCNKKCAHGFRRDVANDCLHCHCNRCPRLTCQLSCPNGYQQDETGCNVCECKESATQTCFSPDGYSVVSGDSWFDGCRQCYCRDGKEMCSLITCPQFDCSQPITKPGDCCPSCPSEGDRVPETVKCLMSDGSVSREQEPWLLDACTVCMCSQGQTMCESETCPPTLCSHPVKRPGECCPKCVGASKDYLITSSSQLYERPCTNVYGATFSHGDVWKVGDCQSCVCQHGHITCFSQVCPALSCRTTILRKGQCCPQCSMTDLLQKICVYNDLWYKNGDTWEDNSAQCECQHGNVKCHSVELEESVIANPTLDVTPSREEASDGWKMSLPVIIILSVLLLIFAVIVVVLIALLVALHVHRRKRAGYSLPPTPKTDKSNEHNSINNNKEFIRRNKKPNNLEQQVGTERKYNSMIDPNTDIECRRSLINPNCVDNKEYHPFT